jgi:hypothetical protein
MLKSALGPPDKIFKNDFLGRLQKPYQNFRKIQNTSKKLKNIIFYQKYNK